MPEILYTVVEFGVAFTTEPLAELNVVAGDQVYVLPPLAVNVAVLPLHISAGLAITAIVVLTVTVTPTFAEFVQVLF